MRRSQLGTVPKGSPNFDGLTPYFLYIEILSNNRKTVLVSGKPVGGKR